ncbi:hypothetical protein COJ77_15305 [Bacillus cereus]|nr:hypothetical protein bcere0022_44300 [Bacillus cereus Rock3-44]PFO81876.1 hypothetical protein COJ77_15305 [Bacillus cereus]
MSHLKRLDRGVRIKAFCYQLKIPVMKTKRALRLFSPCVFTWNGAGKGPDRFYAWADALSSKKRVFLFHIKIMVMKPKRALHSCSLCVFTWLDALFHLKKKVFSCFP